MPDPRYSARVTLRDGRSATVRPLVPGDVEPLTALFLSLSQETRRMYGPHPFDRATAERLYASTGEAATVRFVAVLDDDSGGSQIIGYMILSRDIVQADRDRYGDKLQVEGSACFAPVIADDYQNLGIGTKMARHALACATEMGLKQVVLMGGVRAANERAEHFYRKLGFRRVGEFYSDYHGEKLLSYDMILEF